MNPTALFADAGGPLLLVPIAGGLGLAGLFAASAAVSGGLWLAHGRAAPRARKWFLVSAGVACLGGALFFGVGVMLEADNYNLSVAGTLVLTAAAVALLYLSFRPVPPPDSGGADAPP